MKSISHILILILLVSLIGSETITFGNASAYTGCYTPTGWFASEFILNKPNINFNLDRIGDHENVTVIRSSVIYRMHYNESAAVLLTPLDLFQEKGLDIRLQLPTRNITKTTQFFILETNITDAKIIDLNMMGGRGIGWILDISYLQLIADQPPTQISNLTKGILKITFIPHINETLPGIYIAISVENSTSLSNENITEISRIFDGIGFPTIFKNLLPQFESHLEIKEEVDLESTLGIIPDDFNWYEAMRMELEFLRNNRVLTGLSDQDIEDIAKLAKDAVGEHNFRGRYYDGNWIQGISEEMIEAGITQDFSVEPSCDEFPPSILPSGSVMDFNTGFNLIEIISESSYEGAAIRIGLIVIGLLIVFIYLMNRQKRLHKKRKNQ
ncbi:hypothetical protein ACFL96_09760 [Thermoproteota archaeon]